MNDNRTTWRLGRFVLFLLAVSLIALSAGAAFRIGYQQVPAVAPGLSEGAAPELGQGYPAPYYRHYHFGGFGFFGFFLTFFLIMMAFKILFFPWRRMRRMGYGRGWRGWDEGHSSRPAEEDSPEQPNKSEK